MGKLDGKVAVVTGGGSGIGKAITKAFADEGATVVIAARNLERLESAAKEIGGAVSAVRCDVTDESQIEALFERVDADHGPVDILVNNSGLAAPGPSHELDLERWNGVIAVNLTGAFLCSKHALKRMIPRKKGRILNIGSISGQKSRPHSAAYTTSKFGLDGLTRSMALDGREHGIAVSVLHPGNVDTDIWQGMREVAEAEGLIPLEDMGKAALAIVTMDDAVNVLSTIILPITQPYIGRG
jgi:NAD(P)-dependent dehydrogenase (short-subunit alcohol dehydrogenase family)